MSYLAHRRRITADMIYAAMSLYLLVGIMFMNAYITLEHIHPGTFHMTIERDRDGMINAAEFLYYSFVTMTTLGYGDITPMTAQARSLSILQAIFGVLFMAVVIGRVVGIYSSQDETYSDG